MKTFEVLLTKSYIVEITAKDRQSAKEFSQVFTGDINDLSNEQDREKFKFIIESIDCKQNEVFEVLEKDENSFNE
jgi:cytidylate kinase